jgi:bla regulator protein blaR1
MPQLRLAFRIRSTALAILLVGPASASSGDSPSPQPGRAAGDSYVLCLTDGTTSTNISVEMQVGQVEEARRSAERTSPSLWFRRAGKSYWIRDSATLEKAEALFRPLRALEPEQEDLRRKEEALEDRQRELDRQDEDLDRQIDRLTDGGGDDEDSDADADADADEDRDMDVDAGAERNVAADPAPVSEELEQLRSRQKEIQARGRELEAQDRELDRAERSLDAREDSLERQAEAGLWALIDDAIRGGVAKPDAGNSP